MEIKLYTIEERAEEYSKDNWGMGYSKNLEIMRSKEGYICGATEQRNIDVEKACKCYCDDICEKGMCNMCFHKNDEKGQVKKTFTYSECNELQIIRRVMNE